MARLAFYTQTYNAEKYIAKAIESVLSQAFSDFVYYVVDDASKDNTADIIRQYADKDSRIVPYYSNENRIMGLYTEYLEKIIKSDAEFMCWLDNDDWYEPAFAEMMIYFLENFEADLAVCGSNLYEEESMQIVSTRSGFSKLVKSCEYGAHFTQMHRFLRPVWGKVYRLSVFRNNEIKFRDNLHIGADTVFVLDFVKKARGVYIHGDTLHNYLFRSNSISRAYNENTFASDVFQHEYSKQWLVDMNADTQLNRAFLASVYLNALNDSSGILFSSDLAINEKVSLYKEMFTNNDAIESFGLLNSPDYPQKEALQRLKGLMLKTLLRLDDEGFSSQLYDVFCVAICPDIKPYYEPSHLVQLIDGNYGILKHFINSDFNGLSEEASVMPESAARDGLIKMLIDKDEMMTGIKAKDALLYYPQIVDLVFRKEYQTAADEIQDIIISDFDNDPESVYALADLLQYLSAFNEDTEKYLLSKQALLIIYLERKDKASFYAIADDIEIILPGDADVLNMRKTMEEGDDIV
jgi:glycosyltransferase involved in cell wall biosynthesis